MDLERPQHRELSSLDAHSNRARKSPAVGARAVSGPYCGQAEVNHASQLQGNHEADPRRHEKAAAVLRLAQRRHYPPSFSSAGYRPGVQPEWPADRKAVAIPIRNSDGTWSSCLI